MGWPPDAPPLLQVLLQSHMFVLKPYAADPLCCARSGWACGADGGPSVAPLRADNGGRGCAGRRGSDVRAPMKALVPAELVALPVLPECASAALESDFAHEPTVT
jgi:hypothetical protein